MRAAVNTFAASGTQPDRNTPMQSDQNIVSIDRDPAMIEFKGVSKFFERRNQFGDDNDCLNVALDRVNASVGKGEFITLLGPSGCGKTTLLRLAAGLMRPDEGIITIQGQKVNVQAGEWIVAEDDGIHYYPIADGEFQKRWEPVK